MDPMVYTILAEELLAGLRRLRLLDTPAGERAGDDLDEAAEAARREADALARQRLVTRATELIDALDRLARGVWGQCTECGVAINPKRLAAMPAVATCVYCQTRLEHEAGAGRRTHRSLSDEPEPADEP